MAQSLFEDISVASAVDAIAMTANIANMHKYGIILTIRVQGSGLARLGRVQRFRLVRMPSMETLVLFIFCLKPITNNQQRITLCRVLTRLGEQFQYAYLVASHLYDQESCMRIIYCDSNRGSKSSVFIILTDNP